MSKFNFLNELLFGHSDPLAELEGGIGGFQKTPDNALDPVGRFLQKTEFDLLAKTGGVLDARWDDPLTKAIAVPATFSARSDQRFEKACDVIRRVFADNSDAAEQAIRIAGELRASARADALALAAAA
jgi:hypothetical protein